MTDVVQARDCRTCGQRYGSEIKYLRLFEKICLALDQIKNDGRFMKEQPIEFTENVLKELIEKE